MESLPIPVPGRTGPDRQLLSLWRVMNDRHYSEVLGAWTKTLPEEGPQECLCLGGHSFLLKVLSCGGSDWLSDLQKFTAVSQATSRVSLVLLWATEEEASEYYATQLCFESPNLSSQSKPHLLRSPCPAFPPGPNVLPVFQPHPISPPLENHSSPLTCLDIPMCCCLSPSPVPALPSAAPLWLGWGQKHRSAAPCRRPRPHLGAPACEQ